MVLFKSQLMQSNANLHSCFHTFEEFIRWTGRRRVGKERGQWLHHCYFLSSCTPCFEIRARNDAITFVNMKSSLAFIFLWKTFIIVLFLELWNSHDKVLAENKKIESVLSENNANFLKYLHLLIQACLPCQKIGTIYERWCNRFGQVLAMRLTSRLISFLMGKISDHLPATLLYPSHFVSIPFHFSRFETSPKPCSLVCITVIANSTVQYNTILY